LLSTTKKRHARFDLVKGGGNKGVHIWREERRGEERERPREVFFISL